MSDEHDPRWVPGTEWVPATRWKERLLMWVVYLVAGVVLGTGVTALTLWLLTFLGVEL